MAAVVALVLAIAILALPLPQADWTSEWYRFLPSSGVDSDPLNVFKLEDGVLHVLDLPLSGQAQEFGYLGTRREFSNYHLSLRYRWGEKRFAPRANDKRDAGVLYHVVGPDVIWPRSVECQIQEGDTGDIFFVSGTGAATTIAAGEQEPRYEEGGVPYEQVDGRIVKARTVDSLTDWNTVEVLVTGDQSVHIVDGVVVARVAGMTQPGGLTLDRGRILLQAEGAEVFYDAVQLQEFTDFVPPPAGAITPFGGSIEVVPGGGDTLSAEQFGDFRLHVEFLVPPTSPSLSEQERGNSGIYLQQRYELQVLDSFGATLADRNDASALYDLKDADVNASRPSGIWQSYDVKFRAARFVDGVKTENARVSVVWNGVLVQNDVELPAPTPGGIGESPAPGAILFQDHGNPVRYRNVWVVPE